MMMKLTSCLSVLVLLMTASPQPTAAESVGDGPDQRLEHSDHVLLGLQFAAELQELYLLYGDGIPPEEIVEWVLEQVGHLGEGLMCIYGGGWLELKDLANRPTGDGTTLVPLRPTTGNFGEPESKTAFKVLQVTSGLGVAYCGSPDVGVEVAPVSDRHTPPHLIISVCNEKPCEGVGGVSVTDNWGQWLSDRP